MKDTLKTLKDLQKPIRNDEGSCLRVEELKAEAVKWVKMLEDTSKCPFVNKGAVLLFKDFFNLTDEDLKQEKKDVR